MVDLKSFIKDINYVGKIKDTRYNILVLQLYVEHFMNEIISLKSGDFSKEVIRERLTIPIKSKMLLDWKIIGKEEKKIIDVLAKTRNDMVHNLVLDMEKLEKKLKSTNFEFIKDKNGKPLKLFKNLNPLGRLQSSSAIIISYLYQRLEILKGNKINQKVMLEIKKEGGNFKHILHLMLNK